MKLGITLPIYIRNDEHFYFTEQTLASIQTKHDYEIVLVVNHLEEKYKKDLYELGGRFPILSYPDNPHGNNVSGGWNYGIQTLFDRGMELVLVPNNDIIMHPQCIDNLVEFYEKTQEEFVMWSAIQHSPLRTINTVIPGDSYDNHPGFSFFAVSKSGVEKLAEKERGTAEPVPGLFDPGYKGAYFEDQDYHQRILRAGFDGGKTASALYYHFGSRTISVDQELNHSNYSTYEHNRKYFAEKWGYDAHGRGFSNEERVELGFKTAFNR
jgi:GT2 family glycosyltransferase